MSDEYGGYRQMVGELSHSGFNSGQSEALVRMFARAFERMRAENKAEHERTRSELREELNRFREEDKQERERIRNEDREERERIRREDQQEQQRFRSEFQEGLQRFRSEFQDGLQGFRSEFQDGLQGFRGEFQTGLQGFRHEDREDKIKLQNRFENRIAAHTRWMIVTLCTIVLTVVGALVAYVLTNLRMIGLP